MCKCVILGKVEEKLVERKKIQRKIFSSSLQIDDLGVEELE